MARPDEVLQTPLQFLKGVGPRKAADFAARRPQYRRRPPLSISAALRGSQPAAVDRVAARRADRVDRRKVITADCAARGVRACASSRRCCATPGTVRSRLVQLGLSEGPDSRGSGWWCTARSSATVTGLQIHEPAVRVVDDDETETSTPAASCRSTSGRDDHAEDAAPARARRAAGLPAELPIRCPTRARRARCRRGATALRRRISAAEDAASTRSTRSGHRRSGG